MTPDPRPGRAPVTPGDAPASFGLRVRVAFWASLNRLLRPLVLARRRRTSRWRILGDAEAAIEAGRPAQARRLLRPYLAQNPTDVDGWVMLGASHAGDETALIADLEQVRELAKNTPVLAMMLGVAYARIGNRAKVLEWAEAADRDPKIARTLRSQGVVANIMGALHSDP